MFCGSAAGNVPHHRINTQTLGIVGVFVAGQSAVYRLPQQGSNAVLGIATGSIFIELKPCRPRQTQGFIKLSVCQEIGITRDFGSMKFELQSTVKIEPQGILASFTHRVLPLTMTKKSIKSFP